MGQGRRWLAALLVWLFAFSAVAAELPSAPSSERPQPPIDLAELRSLGPRPAYDVAELVAQPTALAQPVIAETAPAKAKRVFDKKFAVLAGLAAGLTIADFEMTQRCLQRHTCAEADPLMPTSHAAMYATNLPLNAALFWWSYRRKQDGKRLWWLAPLMVVGSHVAGVGSNVGFVGN